ncbi:MAG: Bug family tripartite tricarboxylate transporter substrate binding protein [Hydrogenophaga sp.]|jgi:tripartite-type tricarboxylate transporter receptor subunit TctC|uniref:Bug family tripartite tricarboxylate transporter substrate binding protein n=1 Tax=Hydrogenophaga intermedia TaxID=65786 RepID=UPI002043B321|nr:tripartite tricarboxylate transporter substrate binding protein [Hydrogenophaga intermedia]MCM3563821.1 tripartite tricarboxylate transporter substrate binding protein [Hydrogenophaga intermedia]
MTTPRQPNRRDALLALGAGTAALALPAAAQSYPDRAVRLVVPFGAGTTTDIISRVVGEGLGRELGQSIVVDNRAGAGGTVGSAQVARGAADGYQLLMGTVGTHAINATLFKSLSYDPIKDFAPIALVGYTPTLLVVAGDGPIKTLADLKAKAAQGQGVTFASAGNGTSGHLAGELLKARLGGQMLHVPYKEGGMAMNDVMTSRADFMFYHPAAVLPHMQAGKLRALGASGAQRSAAARDVPTIAEQTSSDFDLVAWFMLYAPAATPAPVVARLRQATAAALAKAETAGKLAAQGVEQRPLGPDAMDAFARTEVAKWAALVRQSGAQVD